MPYYEMSLENQREYVYQNDFTVMKNAFGVWLTVFLDVDWDCLIKKKQSPSVKIMKELCPNSDGCRKSRENSGNWNTVSG